MTLAPYSLLLGFIAAALSVLVVHQGIVFALNKAGVWPVKPWSMVPIGPLKVPTIINSVFWGGLWGVVFVALQRHIPGDGPLLQGLIFGLLMALVSNFTLLPLIKGQPLFFGFDGRKIAIVLMILAGFGMGMALILHWLRTVA